MTYKHKIGGKTLSVARVKRKQKRKRRRLVEANDQDWARWDAEADRHGLTFSEFARRALHGMCVVSEMRRDAEAASAAAGNEKRSGRCTCSELVHTFDPSGRVITEHQPGCPVLKAH